MYLSTGLSILFTGQIKNRHHIEIILDEFYLKFRAHILKRCFHRDIASQTVRSKTPRGHPMTRSKYKKGFCVSLFTVCILFVVFSSHTKEYKFWILNLWPEIIIVPTSMSRNDEFFYALFLFVSCNVGIFYELVISQMFHHVMFT